MKVLQRRDEWPICLLHRLALCKSLLPAPDAAGISGLGRERLLVEKAQAELRGLLDKTLG